MGREGSEVGSHPWCVLGVEVLSKVVFELVVVPFPSSINFNLQTFYVRQPPSCRASPTFLPFKASSETPLTSPYTCSITQRKWKVASPRCLCSKTSSDILLLGETEFSFPPSLLVPVKAASESTSTLFEEQLGSVRRRSLEDRRFERIFQVVDLERGRRSLYLR